MTCSGLAFFLLSFQVHEKSILLACLPASLLLLREGLPACGFLGLAAFSMYPLLRRDGLSGAYVGCLLVWAVVTALRPQGAGKADAGPRWLRAAMGTSVAGCVGLHGLQAVVPPPARLPYLHAALFSAFAFGHFAAWAVYVNWRMWRLEEEPASQRGGGRPRRPRPGAKRKGA